MALTVTDSPTLSFTFPQRRLLVPSQQLLARCNVLSISKQPSRRSRIYISYRRNRALLFRHNYYCFRFLGSTL